MAHKHISYELKKTIKLEPAIICKLVTCQRITAKNSRPRWVDTWAHDTVRWYWLADTLFWQLSTDHNIGVQYVCNISFPMLPNSLESVRLNIGSPMVRTDGWCTVTWLPTFLGWVDLLSYGALLSYESRIQSWFSEFFWQPHMYLLVDFLKSGTVRFEVINTFSFVSETPQKVDDIHRAFIPFGFNQKFSFSASDSYELFRLF